MANGSLIKTNGKKVMLNRGYKSVPDYSPPSQTTFGINNGTPGVAGNSLLVPIPVADGTTNDDGSNTLTGSNGGDNSTDNTTTYKEGAGNTDVTAQNLIANDTNATKTWSISNLATNGAVIDSSQYCALWFYVLDATTLAKFLTSGTALEIKLGSDSSNYYSKTYTASDLSVGWNFLTLGVVSDLTETGTVGSPIDYFEIEITTNNATDEFIAGDVIYDLLRQWEDADFYQSFRSGYPTIDETKLEATQRVLLNSGEANGFFINGIGTHNSDSTPFMIGEDTIDGDSKSTTDEFVFIIKDRYE